MPSPTRTAEHRRPRLIGINHVALEVGDVDEALAFYGRFFDFELRGRADGMAFLDMGDQFLALTATAERHRDGERHFGLVVDDREGLRSKLEAAGVEVVAGARLDFLDPWGNRIQVVAYPDIQQIKDQAVLDALGASHLDKTAEARAELEAKGIRLGRLAATVLDEY